MIGFLVVLVILGALILVGLFWLILWGTRGNFRLGQKDDPPEAGGVDCSPGVSRSIFWAIGTGLVFALLCVLGAIAFVAFFLVTSWNPDRIVEYVVAEAPSGKGSANGAIVMKVLLSGSPPHIYVDGEPRRTTFEAAEYVLRKDGKDIHLTFLDTADPDSIWDNFVFLGGRWHAINFTRSRSSVLEKNENPRVEVALFNLEGGVEEFTIAIPYSQCHPSTAWITVDGRFIAGKAKYGEYWLSPIQPGAIAEIVTWDEISATEGRLSQLSHEPVVLPTTYGTTVRDWCR